MLSLIIISLLLFRKELIVEASQCEIADICVTDLSQEECDAATVLTPNSNIYGCCPSCQFPGAGGSEDNNKVPCQAPYNCLPDGRFAAVQCKGDLFKGRCFCSDENGNRIFGQMWRNEASKMTCACSRRRHELETSGTRSVTLHCTPIGDYEPLQCDDGICWCAEPSTGQPTVIPVPEIDMKLLPCYSASSVGENYLRRCESLTHAYAAIYKEQTDHGTTFYGNPTTFCDYDGSFGAYQIQNGIAYCTGRDGKILGAWQVESSAMNDMNCNCARDTAIYFPERGMTVTAVCTANGSYRPNQNAGDIRYCLDSDGYTLAEEDWPPACIIN